MSIDEAGIWDKINSAETEMSLPQRRLWDVVRIIPVKWRVRAARIDSDDLWVVAIIGSTAIWYNEFEEGFCRSVFAEHGEIDEFKWNDDELGHTIQNVLNEISTGINTEIHVSPPRAGPHPLDS